MISRVLTLAVLAATLGLLGGCAATGEPAGATGKVEILRVDSPLREPVWVPGEENLLALGQNKPDVALLDPEAAVPAGEPPQESAVVRSTRLEGAGGNVALNVRHPDRAYVPQPERGEVSVLNTQDLQKRGSLEAGEAPEQVTVDAASETLFSLSENGSEVLGMDLESSEKTPAIEVGGGEQTLIESPHEGLTPEFWAAGPEGVVHYAGSPPERKAGMDMEAAELVPDASAAQRAYIAGARRVSIVEGDPEGLLEGELEVAAGRDLGEEVEQLATDELYVYAATKDEVVAMRRHDLRTVETVDLRRPLEEESLEEAPLTGIAVGEERVYLTLSEEPYVLSVEKP